MFVLATAVAFLASTTAFFGVLWRRERAKRRRCEKRLETQEASFAAALGSSHAVVEQTREYAKRVTALEREIAIMRPIVADMAKLVRMNS